MQYEVRFVRDGDLPVRHDWAMVRQGRITVLFIKQSALSPHVLEQAWRAGNLLANQRLEREHGFPAAL